MKRNTKGITLIALVITVIILLILAGVAIGATVGNKGTIGQTHQATADAQKQSIVEKIQADLLTEKTKTGKTLTKSELINIIKENGYAKEEPGTDSFVSKDGEYEIKYEEITGWLRIMVGDTVDYTPDTVTEEEKSKLVSDLQKGLSEGYNGKIKNTSVNQKDFNWKVYNITDDSVELISDGITDDYIALYGVLGFTNGVYLLNEYCNVLYNNQSVRATARSMNIEDITDKLKTDENGKKVYEDFEDYIKYGETAQILSLVPKKWQEDKDENLSSSGTLREYQNEEEAWDFNEVERKLKQTYWSEDLEGQFISVNTREGSKSDYYEGVCGIDEDYWIASRYTYVFGDSVTSFGIRELRSSSYELAIYGTDLCYIDRIGGGGFQKVRPIVEIPINKIDLDGDYEANGNMWKLK